VGGDEVLVHPPALDQVLQRPRQEADVATDVDLECTLAVVSARLCKGVGGRGI